MEDDEQGSFSSEVCDEKLEETVNDERLRISQSNY